MKRYMKLQIIKHSLMEYIKRPNATDKELEQEKRLLNEITERAEMLKSRYGIK